MRKVRAALGPVFMVAIAAGSVTAGMVACGGDDKGLADPSSMSCGPGTVAEGNQCVAVDAGVGGSGGEGGGNSGQGGTAGESAGGAAGADAETPEAASDVVEEGAPGPGDDPCPDEPLFLNCSDSCGPKSPECEQLTCAFPWPPVHAWTDKSVTRIVVRTPSNPGMNNKCKEECEKLGEPGVYASLLSLHILTDDPSDCQVDYRAQVSPPWYVNYVSSDYDMCPWADYENKSCFVVKCGDRPRQRVFTSDPAAPARNVVFERVPNPGSCP